MPTRSRRKIRTVRGRARHGRGNRKHRRLLPPSLPPLPLIIPFRTKEDNDFSRSRPFSSSDRPPSIYSISDRTRSKRILIDPKPWESKRQWWFRDGRLDSNAAGISKTEREREREEGEHRSTGMFGTKRYCILDLIESGNLFVHRDFLRLVWLARLFQRSHNIAFCRESTPRISFPDDSREKSVSKEGEGGGSDKACN